MTEYEFHPLAEQYPLLDGDDIKAMADDIKANGQRFPILLYEGKILDGRNRYIACKIAGVEPSFDAFPPDIDPADFVESANLHRRHLTVSQKREAIVRKLKADPAKSNSAIAAETKASDKTVAAVRHELEAGSEIPNLETRKGKDGKEQPAKKPPKPRKPEPWDEETTSASPKSSPQREPGEDDEAIPSQAGDVLLDGLGLRVPKESMEAFGSCALFDELLSLHRKMTAAVHELALSPGGWWFQLRACGKTTVGDKVKFRSDRLHTFRSDIKFNRPFAARCPYCHHEGLAKNSKRCRACTGMPYVSEDLWNNAPQDYRDAMLKDLGGQS